MDDFINNIINTWGESGAIWLDNLSEVIEKISKKWGLTDILAFPNLSYGFVAEAMQNDKPVVLKITFHSIIQEYTSLKHYDGHGVISVMDVDFDLNSLLLQKAVPGVSLKYYPTSTILNKMAIYADVVNKIASVSLNNEGCYPHISKWCEDLSSIQSDIINKKLSDKALRLAEYLLKTSKNEYLCHGDLHLDNILEANSEWLAIDPKGVIAEKEFEVAAFPLLTDEEIDKKVNLAKRIMVRNHSLATQFGFTQQRLLSWIFVRNILSAKWHIEDNGNPDKSIFMAEQIFSLLKADD